MAKNPAIILPCPWCGSDNLVLTEKDSAFFLECQNPYCPTMPCAMSQTSAAHVIDLWNTRADDVSQEAYTLRWLRQECEEAGWDLLDLVEAARDHRVAHGLNPKNKKAPPF